MYFRTGSLKRGMFHQWVQQLIFSLTRECTKYGNGYRCIAGMTNVSMFSVLDEKEGSH
jgi:hypothetical protein